MSYLLTLKPRPMRRFVALMMCAVSLGAAGQITYPYNPDGNADSLISVPDIQDFLSVYGNSFAPNEIMIGDSTLSSWVLSLSQTVSHQSATIDSLFNLLNTDGQGQEATGQGGFYQIGSELDCESAMQMPLGTVVFNDQNANGSLHVLTPGPDCNSEPLQLFETEQASNGSAVRYFYWFFQVTDSIYVFDLPDIEAYGIDATSRLGKVNSALDGSLDLNVEYPPISWLLSDASSSHVLLVPENYYVWRTGATSSYNYPTYYSSSMPPFDESLFVTHSNWEDGWGSNNPASPSTKWGLGVEGQRFGFSYAPVGKVWQTLIDW